MTISAEAIFDGYLDIVRNAVGPDTLVLRGGEFWRLAGQPWDHPCAVTKLGFEDDSRVIASEIAEDEWPAVKDVALRFAHAKSAAEFASLFLPWLNEYRAGRGEG